MNKLVMERLYKFVEDKNIALKYIDGLRDKYDVKGFYTNMNNKHCILLDKDLLDNPDEHQQILAEECGHYSTTMGDTVKDNACEHYLKVVEDAEYYAERWANFFITSPEDFNKALYECNTQLEISDFLDIELEYVEKRLGYLKISCPIHTLTENLAVNLYKLPEIYKIDLTHIKRVVFE